MSTPGSISTESDTTNAWVTSGGTIKMQKIRSEKIAVVDLTAKYNRERLLNTASSQLCPVWPPTEWENEKKREKDF